MPPQVRAVWRFRARRVLLLDLLVMLWFIMPVFLGITRHCAHVVILTRCRVMHCSRHHSLTLSLTASCVVRYECGALTVSTPGTELGGLVWLLWLLFGRPILLFLAKAVK